MMVDDIDVSVRRGIGSHFGCGGGFNSCLLAGLSDGFRPLMLLLMMMMKEDMVVTVAVPALLVLVGLARVGWLLACETTSPFAFALFFALCSTQQQPYHYPSSPCRPAVRPEECARDGLATTLEEQVRRLGQVRSSADT
jgi:hypothetical protein